MADTKQELVIDLDLIPGAIIGDKLVKGAVKETKKAMDGFQKALGQSVINPKITFGVKYKDELKGEVKQVQMTVNQMMKHLVKNIGLDKGLLADVGDNAVDSLKQYFESMERATGALTKKFDAKQRANFSKLLETGDAEAFEKLSARNKKSLNAFVAQNSAYIKLLEDVEKKASSLNNRKLVDKKFVPILPLISADIRAEIGKLVQEQKNYEKVLKAFTDPKQIQKAKVIAHRKAILEADATAERIAEATRSFPFKRTSDAIRDEIRHQKKLRDTDTSTKGKQTADARIEELSGLLASLTKRKNEVTGSGLQDSQDQRRATLARYRKLYDELRAGRGIDQLSPADIKSLKGYMSGAKTQASALLQRATAEEEPQAAKRLQAIVRWQERFSRDLERAGKTSIAEQQADALTQAKALFASQSQAYKDTQYGSKKRVNALADIKKTGAEIGRLEKALGVVEVDKFGVEQRLRYLTEAQLKVDLEQAKSALASKLALLSDKTKRKGARTAATRLAGQIRGFESQLGLSSSDPEQQINAVLDSLEIEKKAKAARLSRFNEAQKTLQATIAAKTKRREVETLQKAKPVADSVGPTRAVKSKGEAQLNRLLQKQFASDELAKQFIEQRDRLRQSDLSEEERKVSESRARSLLGSAYNRQVGMSVDANLTPKQRENAKKAAESLAKQQADLSLLIKEKRLLTAKTKEAKDATKALADATERLNREEEELRKLNETRGNAYTLAKRRATTAAASADKAAEALGQMAFARDQLAAHLDVLDASKEKSAEELRKDQQQGLLSKYNLRLTNSEKDLASLELDSRELGRAINAARKVSHEEATQLIGLARQVKQRIKQAKVLLPQPGLPEDQASYLSRFQDRLRPLRAQADAAALIQPANALDLKAFNRDHVNPLRQALGSLRREFADLIPEETLQELNKVHRALDQIQEKAKQNLPANIEKKDRLTQAEQAMNAEIALGARNYQAVGGSKGLQYLKAEQYQSTLAFVDSELKRINEALQSSSKLTDAERATLDKARVNYQRDHNHLKQDILGNISLIRQIGTAVNSFMRYAVVYGGLYQLSAAFSGLVRNVVNFQDSLKQIQAIAQATDGQMVSLASAIRSVASTSPYNMQELAASAQTLAQAGIDIQKLPSALRAVSQMAAATGGDTNTAADILTSAQRIFPKLSDQQIADQITRTVNISKLNPNDIQTIFNLAAQTASASNVKSSQFLGTAATLSNLGIKGSTIATGLRQLMLELFSPDPQLTQFYRSRYAAIGETNMNDAAIRTKFMGFQKTDDPMGAAFAEMKRLGIGAGGPASDQFRRIMETRAENVGLPLLRLLDVLEENIKRVADSIGAAAEGAAVRNDTLVKALGNLGDELESTADVLGESLLQSLKELAKGGTDAVRSIRAEIDERKAKGQSITPNILPTVAATLGAAMAAPAKGMGRVVFGALGGLAAGLSTTAAEGVGPVFSSITNWLITLLSITQILKAGTAKTIDNKLTREIITGGAIQGFMSNLGKLFDVVKGIPKLFGSGGLAKLATLVADWRLVFATNPLGILLGVGSLALELFDLIRSASPEDRLNALRRQAAQLKSEITNESPKEDKAKLVKLQAEAAKAELEVALAKPNGLGDQKKVIDDLASKTPSRENLDQLRQYRDAASRIMMGGGDSAGPASTLQGYIQGKMDAYIDNLTRIEAASKERADAEQQAAAVSAARLQELTTKEAALQERRIALMQNEEADNARRREIEKRINAKEDKNALLDVVRPGGLLDQRAAMERDKLAIDAEQAKLKFEVKAVENKVNPDDLRQVVHSNNPEVLTAYETYKAAQEKLRDLTNQTEDERQRILRGMRPDNYEPSPEAKKALDRAREIENQLYDERLETEESLQVLFEEWKRLKLFAANEEIEHVKARKDQFDPRKPQDFGKAVSTLEERRDEELKTLEKKHDAKLKQILDQRDQLEIRRIEDEIKRLQSASRQEASSPDTIRQGVRSLEGRRAAEISAQSGSRLTEVQRTIQRAATKHGINPALMLGIAEQESNFNPSAHNPGNDDAGLFQFIPRTWRGVQRNAGLSTDLQDRYDPEKAADAAARLLKDLTAIFGNDTRAIIAAYNAGPNKVKRYLSAGRNVADAAVPGHVPNIMQNMGKWSRRIQGVGVDLGPEGTDSTFDARSSRIDELNRRLLGIRQNMAGRSGNPVEMNAEAIQAYASATQDRLTQQAENITDMYRGVVRNRELDIAQQDLKGVPYGSETAAARDVAGMAASPAAMTERLTALETLLLAVRTDLIEALSTLTDKLTQAESNYTQINQDIADGKYQGDALVLKDAERTGYKQQVDVYRASILELNNKLLETNRTIGSNRQEQQIYNPTLKDQGGAYGQISQAFDVDALVGELNKLGYAFNKLGENIRNFTVRAIDTFISTLADSIINGFGEVDKQALIDAHAELRDAQAEAAYQRATKGEEIRQLNKRIKAGGEGSEMDKRRVQELQNALSESINAQNARIQAAQAQIAQQQNAQTNPMGQAMEGLAKEGASTLLKTAMLAPIQGLLSKFGVGQPGSSATNPIYAKIVNSPPDQATSGLFGGMFDGVTDWFKGIFSPSSTPTKGGSSSSGIMDAIYGIGNIFGGMFANGGYVSGPGTGTSDSIPAWLSNGEYVLTAKEVQSIGVGNLNRWKAGMQSPAKFASGGLVSTFNQVTDKPPITQANAASGSVINVIDQRSTENSAPVQVQRRQGPNNKEIIEVMVRDAVKKAIVTGQLDSTMGAVYGARRTGGMR